MGGIPQLPDKIVDAGNGNVVAFPGNMDDLTISTHIKQHLSAGGAGTVAPQPLANKMSKVEPITGSEITPEEEDSIQARAAHVQSHSITPVTDAVMGIMGGAGLAEDATRVGLKKAAGSLARGVAKSYGGSVAGKYAGRAVGGETGEEIGQLVGAAAGPFIPGKTMAKVPLIGRMAAGDEAYSEMMAERKLTQRIADEKAGLRPPRITGKVSDGVTAGEAEGRVAGTVATPKGRLVLTPGEARTRERQAPLIKKMASERGMKFAGGFVPEEGRKVPQKPMPTETEEYGGPRTEEQQQEKQSLLERMGARLKKPFLPGGETGAFKVGGGGGKLSQKMSESGKASQLVKSNPEDWTGDDGKPRIVDGIHPDYYRYPSSVIEPDGTSYSGEEHSTIDESGLSNKNTRVRIIRSTHEIGIDVDDPKNITPEQLKILASESKGKQTIYFDYGTGGSEEFRTFGEFQRFLDKIRGQK